MLWPRERRPTAALWTTSPGCPGELGRSGDATGRRRYLDADFGSFSVEVDGAVHLLPLTHWEDMARHNDLLLVTGKPMLRFSSAAVRTDPATVVAQLAAARIRWR